MPPTEVPSLQLLEERGQGTLTCILKCLLLNQTDIMVMILIMVNGSSHWASLLVEIDVDHIRHTKYTITAPSEG